MMNRNWRQWWMCAGVRAVKTVAQTAVAMIPTAVMVTQVDWVMVGGTALCAGVLSMLTSIAGLPELDEE